MRVFAIVIVVFVLSVLVLVPPARPASGRHWKPPHHHGYPAWWRHQAACVRYRESRGQWNINTGNGYYGAYQFLLSTWAAHVVPGWTLRPDFASPAQQTFVVWRTYIADGRSWREWGSAPSCGL